MKTQSITCAAIVALLLFAGGCCHGFDRHPVTVSLGPAFQQHPPLIEVHIFAANAQESHEWETVPMSEYWGRNRLERSRHESDRVTFTFGPNKPQSQVFSPEIKPQEWNELWSKWEKQNATNLFIMASLPSDPNQPFPDKNGSEDARRLVIPIDKCKWENKEQAFDVVLTPGKVELRTPMKQK